MLVRHGRIAAKGTLDELRRMYNVPVVDHPGCAILPGVLGWLDCTLRHAYDGGDHSIFVGEVVAAGFEPGAPLLYFNRHWRQLSDLRL